MVIAVVDMWQKWVTCVTKPYDNRSKTIDYGISAHDLLDYEYFLNILLL